MGEIERYRDRAEAAAQQVVNLPRTGWGEPGPPDGQTGERWDRGNVLGHMAEMVPFWTGQLRAALGGATSLGRDEAGYAQRRQAIATGRDLGEEELIARIDAGLTALLGLLAELTEKDLDRKLTYHSAGHERQVDLRYPLEELLVGHVEAHLRQLGELS
ncbi:MAG TPA: maleylpyruvate isomerase N-terminal domain-containing protein [Candidatus Dormibacteraeota bacterium]|nr:maleylpyruvate isomerase N-terminal domain-containing protein [Candidatus Dormibacteraeota bacterium]